MEGENNCDEKGDISLMFCGGCRVTYHNPQMKNTYGADGVKVARMLVHLDEGDVEVDGSMLKESLALAVRAGKVPAMEAWLEEGAGEFPWGKAICYSVYRFNDIQYFLFLIFRQRGLQKLAYTRTHYIVTALDNKYTYDNRGNRIENTPSFT